MLLAAMLLLLVDFLVAETLKRLPTLRKTRVQSLGREDLLEKEIATHSNIILFLLGKSDGQRSLEGYCL